MVITICSSVEFTPVIIEIKRKLETTGFSVNIPLLSQRILDNELSFDDYLSSRKTHGGDIHLRHTENVDLIKRYWNFIKGADAVLVINETKNGIQNYIGGNTFMEMGFAYVCNKPIFLYNPIPERSERMHYVDEIMSMKPIIIFKNIHAIKETL